MSFITVTNTGATVSITGRPPYDDVEDTLIVVVTNSKFPISTLGLSSSLSIFGFDGDGIDSFGIPGNALDSTGYGGPNAYFSTISGSQTIATVNFIVPVAANGGTAYFSLENAISSATACSSVINNSVTSQVSVLSGNRPTISATFTPNSGFTIPQAAQFCGFIEFDWQSTITSWPLPSALFAAGSITPLHAPPPLNDPPPQGYAYQTPPNAVQLPVYYNLFTGASDPLSLAHNVTSATLKFFDSPADSCSPGGTGRSCGGKTAPVGSKLAFKTHLVGIMGNLPGAAVVDTGIGFNWTDTFNGTSGGIVVSNTSVPVDANSGTGGITITSVNELTTLSAITITNINGVPPGGPQTLGAGNMCNGTFSGNFTGDVSVSAGQNCTFVDGTITGNVRESGGNLVLSGVLIGGNVEIDGGSTFSIDTFTEIEGNIEIHNLPSVTGLDQICSSTVDGELNIHKNVPAIQIDLASTSSCPGNVVVGNMEIHDNAGATSVFGNSISGHLHDHSNTGTTEIFNNIVLKKLQCENNASITGGSNTAQSKQGQCVEF